MPLLREYLGQLTPAAIGSPVLDLACGTGRNGLYLIQQNIPVVFADIRPEALSQIRVKLTEEPWCGKSHLAELWPVDFEQAGIDPFNGRMFAAVVVYHYLHRPLLESIKQAVSPGGLVLYETFTVDQPQYGRPKNPDFLLRHDELREQFGDWGILHYFEGVVEKTGGDGTKAIAQIVATRPV